ncbi:helix-turn-helix domain-containing protein [Lysinibacillus fusiformis]|nr:helix-turn-helix domain-containing protein [Lysinibacillus fusiformis]
MTAYKVDTKDEFIKLVQSEILTTSEVLEELQISRQALNSLVKRGKLVPVKELSRDKLFLREDIESRKEAAKELHTKYRPYDE